MPNSYFQFQQFRVDQEKSGMKVTTDGCLFGAWVAAELGMIASQPQKILDIGAGTGLLSLMLAQATQSSQFTAVEINETVATEAHSNFDRSPWKERMQLAGRSIQQYATENTFDAIISNPPFFDSSLPGQNRTKNQAVHATSLDQETLLEHIQRLMAPEGFVFLLYPDQEMERFKVLAGNASLRLRKECVVRNSSGDPIFRRMAQFGQSTCVEETTELIIRRGDGRYTDEFWALLKDYYLEYNDPNRAQKSE